MEKGNYQRNNSLDFLKGVACIGVVLIHVTFPGIFGAVLSKLSIFAVPLFFMISGYYAYDEKGKTQTKIKRRAIKVLKIFCMALLLYVPYRMFRMYELGQLKSWIEGAVRIETFFNAIFFHSFDYIGAEHLWFLSALLYTYLLMLAVDKYELYYLFYKLLPMLLGLNVLSGMGIIGALGGTFLIRAVPFFVLGNYVVSHRQIVENYSNTVLKLFIATNAIFICICFGMDWKYNPYQFAVIAYSFAIFVYAIKNPNNNVSEKIELLGRKYSLYVYVIHICINSRLNVWINCLDISEVILVKWMLPIVVIVLSIGISILLDFFIARIVVRKP